MNDRNTEVLEQYELEIKAFRRGRGAWVCETDKGRTENATSGMRRRLQALCHRLRVCTKLSGR